MLVLRGVRVGVFVGLGVLVGSGVGVFVGFGVFVGVGDGGGVLRRMVPSTVQTPLKVRRTVKSPYSVGALLKSARQV